MKKRGLIAFGIGFFLVSIVGVAWGAGPFGPPEPVSKGSQMGWHVGGGYFYHQDKWEPKDEGSDSSKIRSNQIYLEVGKNFSNVVEIYGRVGAADLTVDDFFENVPGITFSKRDFEGDWQPFGTLGIKGFHPIDKVFGIGIFAQGTYYFGDFEDSVSANVVSPGGILPVNFEVKFNDVWEFNLGAGLQATVLHGIRLYAGPYFHWTVAEAEATASLAGLSVRATEDLENETKVGGFAGIDIPFAQGIRLNIEGKYSKEFSVGAALTYSF